MREIDKEKEGGKEEERKKERKRNKSLYRTHCQFSQAREYMIGISRNKYRLRVN